MIKCLRRFFTIAGVWVTPFLYMLGSLAILVGVASGAAQWIVALLLIVMWIPLLLLLSWAVFRQIEVG